MSSFDQRIADSLGHAVPMRPELSPNWSDVRARATHGRRRVSRRQWKPALVAVVVVLALAGVGVAIADGFGAFDGIGAVQHPQTGSDVIDPATRAYMEGGNGDTMPVIGGLLFDTARHVGRLSNGQNVYVITTTKSSLCFVVGPPDPEWSCSDPLSSSHPATDFAYTAGPKPWTTIGVAVDGATAVSFEANGREVTLPVTDNFWTYTTDDFEALNAPLLALTVHFADGTTLVDRCPMC
ncbi:MAG: hypothetical protein ACRDLM_02005 [Gaiellaceae bacterium]